LTSSIYSRDATVWMERVVGAAARKKPASSAEEQEEAKKHFEQS